MALRVASRSSSANFMQRRTLLLTREVLIERIKNNLPQPKAKA